MNIIKPNDLKDYPYVILPPNFEIQDEPQIIFAPNGTGKTTLFNILISQNKNNCDVYSYDDSCEPNYKLIEGKKKKLIINPLSTNYSTELSNRDSEANKLDSKNALLALFPNKTIAQIKKVVKDKKDLLDVAESNVCTIYSPLDDSDRENLKYILPFFDDLKKAISDRDTLFSLTDEQKKSDIESLRLIDSKLIYTYYDVESHKEDIEKNGCPLCGNKKDGVYDDIIKIKNKIINAKFAFFEGCEFLKHLPSGLSPLEAINKTIFGITSLTDEKMLFLLMTKGNKDAEAQIKVSIDNYNTSNKKVSLFINERDKAYNDMRNSKTTIEKYFPVVYPLSVVKFDDKNKTIEITTPRNMNTYSEGEKHEMYSTVRELAIIGSDKKYVIADDPLTEFDVANEYKNVFRFVKLANENHKKVIIFTCNLNFINIANGYYCSLFKRYYLISQKNKKDDSFKLKLLEMDFPNNLGKGAYVSLNQAIGSDLSKLNNQVVTLIYERANLYLSIKKSDRIDEISKVLHYDCSSNVSLHNKGTEIIFCNDIRVS